MTEVHFHYGEGSLTYPLRYVVMVTSHNGKYIFVKNLKRGSWEIPGGRVEEGESAEEAAHREVYEETGGRIISLDMVCIYSVVIDGVRTFGALYRADVEDPGRIPDNSEIGEIMLSNEMPEILSFPEIQPILFAKAIQKDKEIR